MVNEFIKFLEKNNALKDFYKNVNIGCHHSLDERIWAERWIMSAFTWSDFPEIDWSDLDIQWGTFARSHLPHIANVLTYAQILKAIEIYLDSYKNEISIWQKNL